MHPRRSGPVISVVVPALNEARVIGRCLESLRRQTLPPDRFEVILVDNGSTDGTAAIARSFAGALALTVTGRAGVRIAALRNLGAARARAPYLAFLDADCVAPRHWLRQALDLMRAGDARIVGAHYRIPPDSSWVARAWYGGLWQMKNGPVAYVPGGCTIVARDLFLNLGGFDETLVTSEDCEFCERAARSAAPVLAIPSLSPVHLGTPQTLRHFYRKQSWHGVNVHRVFLRDVLHSKSRKAVLFALSMLAALAAGAAGLCAGAILENAAWPAAGLACLLAGPLALAARSCAQRKRWSALLPLTVLYAAYGFARAMCLLGIGGARRKPAADRAPAAAAAATELLG